MSVCAGSSVSHPEFTGTLIRQAGPWSRRLLDLTSEYKSILE
uniref:Uncharacterized protein n=1 Tax=Anguilla anguilla TaxID=7936 RepID=A0A0E9SVD8_ANGAN